MNEYSDEDEEQDFSSNEDNDDRIYKRSYNGKRANYRKMGLSQGDADPDDGNLAKNEADSDSELEHFGAKEKGSRAKFNRVSHLATKCNVIT